MSFLMTWFLPGASPGPFLVYGWISGTQLVPLTHCTQNEIPYLEVYSPCIVKMGQFPLYGTLTVKVWQNVDPFIPEISNGCKFILTTSYW